MKPKRLLRMKVTFMPFLCLLFALSYGMSSWPALGYFPTELLPLTSKDAPPPYASLPPPKQMHQPQLPLAMQREARLQGGGEGEASGHPNPPPQIVGSHPHSLSYPASLRRASYSRKGRLKPAAPVAGPTGPSTSHPASS